MSGRTNAQRQTVSGDDQGVAALVGLPYACANCWELAVHALGVFGFAFPMDHAEAIARADELVDVLPPPQALGVPGGTVLQKADILEFAQSAQTHVGVVLADTTRFIHTRRTGSAQSEVARVAAWAPFVSRVLRPKGGVHHRGTEGTEKKSE